jgi:tRNA-splicing ligase RtcB (3'-phosphate/5'-hydroxy nucleic acid ligase)
VDVKVLTTDRPQPPPRVFESSDAPADPAVLGLLGSKLLDADLATAPVVLPDFHHKSSMEMPSSIAVATRSTIRPTLTSSSVNCGMALIAFDADVPDQTAITRFYEGVRERFPHPTTRRRDLSAREVMRAADEGGAFAADRYGVDPASLWRMEKDGRIDLAPYGGVGRLKRELPWVVVQLARMRFGTIGPSNHFVELQRVEEVFDERAASLLGVRQGQLTLQYHGGGGVLAGQLGRLFGRRRKVARTVKAEMLMTKPLFHLASARSLAELRLRRELYFSGGCPPIDADGPEGVRLLLANAAAMNYGFAFRLATYASLCELAGRAFGARNHHLVVDSPHNSIYEEDLDGERVILHRHNSCQAYPASRMAGHPVFGVTGQAILLPGTNRTSSYLCVAADTAGTSLWSACHGAGTMIDDFAARGLSGLDPDSRTTFRYNYQGSEPELVPQLDDRGVNEALGILRSHGIARPVARVRPIAVLN